LFLHSDATPRISLQSSKPLTADPLEDYSSLVMLHAAWCVRLAAHRACRNAAAIARPRVVARTAVTGAALSTLADMLPRQLYARPRWNAGGRYLSTIIDTASISPLAQLKTAAEVVVDPDSVEAERLLDSLEEEGFLHGDKDGNKRRRNVARALALAETSVGRGCARGRVILGCMYRDGVGVHRNLQRAEELLLQSAEGGDPLGKYVLGCLLLDAVKSEQSTYASSSTRGVQREIVVETDKEGTPRARFEMEPGSDVGPETPAALVRRVRKARKTAGFSDLEALAFEKHKEEQARLDYARRTRKATDLFREAANSGVHEANVALANEIVHDDVAAAVALYEKAVKAGHVPSAHFNLGQLYHDGFNTVPPDDKLALKHFSMAAQLGDASAQFYVGHVYRVGDLGVAVNPAMCLQYIQLAALQNHPSATYYLALMHRNGDGGLEASKGTFRRYLDRACDLGDGEALACLADMHYKGSDGAKVDMKRARELFERAGKAGNADAFCSGAAMYFNGIGTKKDEHQAFLLYQEAAIMGSVIALQNLASCYFHGHGTPKSDSIANHFLALVEEHHESERSAAREATSVGVQTVDAPARDMPHIEVSDDGKYKVL
jgi:TPR repeat protein